MFQSIRSAIKSRSFHRKLKHSTPQSLADDLSKDWNDGLVHAQQVLDDGKPIDMGDRACDWAANCGRLSWLYQEFGLGNYSYSDWIGWSHARSMRMMSMSMEDSDWHRDKSKRHRGHPGRIFYAYEAYEECISNPASLVMSMIYADSDRLWRPFFLDTFNKLVMSPMSAGIREAGELAWTIARYADNAMDTEEYEDAVNAIGDSVEDMARTVMDQDRKTVMSRLDSILGEAETLNNSNDYRRMRRLDIHVRNRTKDLASSIANAGPDSND